MREIKFRGKRADNGNWIHGSFRMRLNECFIIPLPIVTSQSKVIPETVGQFTGLYDKNGMRIFEGDIVLFDYVGRNRGVHGKAAVDFINGKFGVHWGWHKEFVPLDGFANTTLEVIGNIHDNPELLQNITPQSQNNVIE